MGSSEERGESLLARVSAITERGVEVELPGSGLLTMVPLDRLFPGESAGAGKTYVHAGPIVIAVGDAIPVLQQQDGLYSRAEAVNRAYESVQIDDHARARVCEIGPRTITCLADDGYQVSLDRGQTERSLEDKYRQRRFRPERERDESCSQSPAEICTREDQWLYVGDRVAVTIKHKGAPARARGCLLMSTPPLVSERAHSSSPLPQVTPPPLVSTVIVLDDSHSLTAEVTECFQDLGVVPKSVEVLEQFEALLRQEEVASGSVLAVLDANCPRLDWHAACRLAANHADLSIVLASSSVEMASRLLIELNGLQSNAWRVLGVWDRSRGVEHLYAVVSRQDAMAPHLSPKSEYVGKSSTTKPSGSTKMATITEAVISGGCRAALDLLIAGADDRCAIVFRIHKRSLSVSIVESAGEKTLADGFRANTRDLHKSPVQDLAIRGIERNTSDARLQEGVYRWFLRAAGAGDGPLSVRGVRLEPQPVGAFAYALFLVSRKHDAFRDRPVPLRLSAVKRALESALTAESLLSQLKRVTALGERAAHFRYMAHEVSGLLLHSSELLQAVTPANSLSMHDAQNVHADVHRAQTILQQMLPGGGVTFEPFSPRGVVEHYLDQHRELEKKGRLSPSVRYGEHAAREVRGRRLVFECVLRNLLANATQQIDEYCGGIGAVEIWLDARKANAGQVTLVLEVADNGPGIHCAHWDCIFEEGVSTRRHGSGLGLALSSRLARDAGATLELVESVVYAGSRFRFTMPAQQP